MLHHHTITILAAFFTILLVAGCPDPEWEPIEPADTEEGALTIEPSVLNFGELAPQEIDTQSFSLVNHTAQDVTVHEIVVTPGGADFRLAGTEGGFVIEAGYTHTIDVQFQPVKEGASEAIVTVETDHPDYTTMLVDVFGFALGDDDPVGDDDDDDPPVEDLCGTIQVDGQAVDFGTVDVGEDLQKTISVTNVGVDPLEILSVQVSGQGFAQVGQVETELFSGDDTSIKVRFTPTADGPAAGSVTIETCDAVRPVVTVDLQGAGHQGCGNNCQGDIYVNYWGIDFGTITGGIAWADFTVTNQGVDPLTLTGIDTPTSIAGGQVTIISGNENAVLQPGQSEYFTFEWTAGDLFGGNSCLDGMDGSYHWITINSDDPDTPAEYLYLFGCADCGGTGLCAMVNFIDLIFCIDASECSDAVTGLLHCTLGFPC